MKSYGQWCGLAKALDLVGERWSLLVVRELLDGPKRYTDLREGIPGVSTDVLAVRLKDLEESGIVARRTLPPPAASRVYELTELGRGLEGPVMSLSRWGMQLMGTKTDADEFRPQWLALGIRGMLRAAPPADVTLDIEHDLGDELVRIRVADGEVRSVPEPEGDPDVIVRADLSTLTALADGAMEARDAFRDGLLELEGDAAALRTYNALFARTART